VAGPRLRRIDMNKVEELKYKIKVHEGAIALSTDILVSLRAELAEVEKPKLRHGNFGIGCSGSGDPHYRIVLNENVWNELGYKNPPGREKSEDIWLGNIFDLLKEWSEDLGEYEKKCKGGNTLKISQSRYVYDGIEFRINPYGY